MTTPTRDERELAPCPFCGSQNISRSKGQTGDGKDWFYIECDDCGSLAEPDVWNRRAAPAPEGWVLAPAAEFNALINEARYLCGHGSGDWIMRDRLRKAGEAFDKAMRAGPPLPAQEQTDDAG